MNTGNFLIEDADLNQAKDICRIIENDEIRNRALANNLAAEIAIKYFTNVDKVVDSTSGLHNISTVLEDIDIADLYLDNNYVDVRFFFDGEELVVPVAHFENQLLPVAYMFIKISKDLSNADVAGFILPENINTDNSQVGYIKISSAELVSYYDIEQRLFLQEDTFAIEDKEIYDYLDGMLDNNYTFYKKLVKSKDGRERLANATRAKVIFNLVSIPQIEDEEDSLQEVSDVEINFLDDNNLQEISLKQEVPIDDIVVTESDREDNDGEIIIDNLQNEIIDDFDNSETFIEEDLSEIDITSQDESMIEIEDLEKNIDTEIIDSAVNNDLENDVDTLFNEGKESIYGVNSNYRSKQSSSFAFIVLIAILGVVGGIGYWAFNKAQNAMPIEKSQEVSRSVEKQETKLKTVDAMPIETVDAPHVAQNSQDYGVPESIPAIEQNLDASVLVENLKVDWEVPAGYVSNASVKRYLVKLGKIIQLNLKTELLLLSKPPITNKISVEIRYNPSVRKFETIGIVASSGEKSVDNLILMTIQKALSMHINTNSDSFTNLKGNPVLVIHL